MTTPDWTIQRGAGGYYGVNRARNWATSVQPTREAAELAAADLEKRALAAEEARRELARELRRLYRGEDDNATL